MSTLEGRKKQIEQELNYATKIEEDLKRKHNEYGENIKNSVEEHNKLVKTLNDLKSSYKNSLSEFSEMKKMINSYKEEQRSFLLRQYERRIKEIVEMIQKIQFNPTTSIFHDFDALKTAEASNFPNLEKKIQQYFDYQKEKLQNLIVSKIEKGLLNDRIYSMAFLIKYEKYFKESLLLTYQYEKIRHKFTYHFLTSKESARMDKPEWMFDFLSNELKEARHIFDLYDSILKTEVIVPEITEFSQLIERFADLIKLKVNQIMNSETKQKRSLVLHFAKELDKFNKFLKAEFQMEINGRDVSCAVASQQAIHINTQMMKIHELKYVQWFREYKKCIKENLSFLGLYAFLDHGITLYETVELVVFHTREFLNGLRYVNREEIKVICFIFTEVEDLKIFIEHEEMDLMMNFDLEGKDLLGNSLEELSALNSSIITLIRSLAENDVNFLVRRMSSFTYTTPEERRKFLVDLSKTMDDYKLCIHCDGIEEMMQSQLDKFFLENLILQIKFTTEEYLEFREFYLKTKKQFKHGNWESDEGLNALNCIFEGKAIPSKLYKKLSTMYHQ